MDYQRLFQQITDEYASRLLNWAIRRSYRRQDAEDLAQEVLCEVFSAVTREPNIDKLENFVWKVAYYVWCRRLRRSKGRANEMSLEESMVVESDSDHSEAVVSRMVLNAELERMRRTVTNLSRRQRDVVVLHYIDGLSISEVARRLGTTEGAVKWHLFDARNRMRRELSDMEMERSFVYHPGRLSVAMSGEGGCPDITRLNESLIRQNLCLLCYREGKTIEDLVKQTGIPRPYLEFDLDWLVKHEFMRLEGVRYFTTFYISNRRDKQRLGEVFLSYKERCIDVLLKSLCDKEEDIKRIGFHGSAFPFGRLLWPLLVLYNYYSGHASPTLRRLRVSKRPPIRPDGGRYYPLGIDQSRDQQINPDGWQDPEGWNGQNGLVMHRFSETEALFWLGVYTFVNHSFEFIGNHYRAKQYHSLFRSLVEPGLLKQFDLEQKELLATAIQAGLVTKTEDGYSPQFVILKHSEYLRLTEQIFAPIVKTLEPVIEELAGVFASEYKKSLPTQVRTNIDWLTYVDISMLTYYTMLFGAGDGFLALPQDNDVGRLYTLVMTYNSQINDE